jgi:hypothetical protein
MIPKELSDVEVTHELLLMYYKYYDGALSNWIGKYNAIKYNLYIKIKEIINNINKLYEINRFI